MVTFVIDALSLYLRGKSQRSPINKRLDGVTERLGSFREEKKTESEGFNKFVNI